MNAPVEPLLEMTTDPMSAILMTFLIGMVLAIASAFSYSIDSSIPSAHDPCYGSPEAVRVGFYGERILFGGGSFSCMRSINCYQASLGTSFAAKASVFGILFSVYLNVRFLKMLSLSEIALPILNTVLFGFVLYLLLLLYTTLVEYAITISLQLFLIGVRAIWKLCVRGFKIFCALPNPGMIAAENPPKRKRSKKDRSKGIALDSCLPCNH